MLNNYSYLIMNVYVAVEINNVNLSKNLDKPFNHMRKFSWLAVTC